MKKIVLILVIFFSAALSSEAVTPKEMQIVNNFITGIMQLVDVKPYCH